jgi:hypothetical protein
LIKSVKQNKISTKNRLKLGPRARAVLQTAKSVSEPADFNGKRERERKSYYFLTTSVITVTSSSSSILILITTEGPKAFRERKGKGRNF